jgi:multidrug efflux pump subunit AcrA (membrane-fusion protein)
MHSVIDRISRALSAVRAKGAHGWQWYRARSLWFQIGIGVVALIVIIGGISFLLKGAPEAGTAQVRTVTLGSVSELSGNGGGASIVGSVRSVTEAELHAEIGGTVKSVHTSLGAYVPAGFVIADLDNASQAAAVLQAEGAYDAAIAARDAQSLPDTRNTARDAYRAAYTSIDTAIENDIDQFFGSPTPTGPRLLINQGHSQDLGRKRQALDIRMQAWQARLATSATADPATLLDQAIADTQAVSSFLLELSNAANETDSDANVVQIAALADARATVDATLARLQSAKGSLRSGSVGATASADASVKSALGTLRAAQANYEKTRVRATIGGTVNYLPIKAGQYVTALEHVATVANNGALEIVAYVPEESRNSLSVGMKVQVEGDHAGTVTAVAPALDPTNKQIEVHIAVEATPDLVNGQSVRITLPAETAADIQKTASSTSTSSTVLLPLTSVKLLSDSRAVFTVDTEGRVVAHTVTIGDVVGDRIEVLSGVSPDMRIITDVRGLSAGQKVQVGGAAE